MTQLFIVAVFHCIVLYYRRYRQGRVLTVVVLLVSEFHGFHVFGKPIFPQRQANPCAALGLNTSQQAFVGLIEGFEEGTKEKGWGWVPHFLILSHLSVGTFSSHYEWNSTLESISAGFPMIMWPMFTKQPFKSKILLECLEISLQICLGVRSVLGEEKVREYVIMLLVEEQ